MSELVLTKTKRRGPQPRRRIDLPNGDFLVPRIEFADETLGVCDRTVARMKLPTTYIGAIAYVPHNESLNIVAASIRRAVAPPKRRKAARP
jgi:hypothetical protein